MNRLLRIMPTAILLISLSSCSGLLPPSSAPAPATSTNLRSPSTTTAPPDPELYSESTQTYNAVNQIVPSEVIKDYLTRKIGATAFGGKVFSAYQIMGTGQAGQVIKLYVWALVEEYYVAQNALVEGTASSEPVVLFIKMQAGKYQIFDFKDAGEGYQYLTVNFPPKILPLINLPADAYNQRVTLLSNETQKAAEAYFGVK